MLNQSPRSNTSNAWHGRKLHGVIPNVKNDECPHYCPHYDPPHCDPQPDTYGATLPSGENAGEPEDEDIPFLATLDNGVEGLYFTTGIGDSVKILDTGDTLDGKTVSGITLSPDSSGDFFTTFGVDFTDGSQGLFYFDDNLPEPGSLAWQGCTLLFMSRRRNR